MLKLLIPLLVICNTPAKPSYVIIPADAQAMAYQTTDSRGIWYGERNEASRLQIEQHCVADGRDWIEVYDPDAGVKVWYPFNYGWKLEIGD